MATDEHKHIQPADHSDEHDGMIKHTAVHPSGWATALLWPFRHWRLLIIIVMLGLVAFIVRQIRSIAEGEDTLLDVKHSVAIEQTPEEVRALRDIGQWEFMAINTEELVERHEAHTFGDKHLVKVFRGTLRLGIDMKQAPADWFTEDTITVPAGKRGAALLLPDVTLLDTTFIDEARTTTFYEDGRFDAKAKQALYDEAAKAMKARALTEENITTTRNAAKVQFTHIFQALGYDIVTVNFVAAP